jgi:hypothetical protein
MPKLITIPINSVEDSLIFDATVSIGVDLSELETVLFSKLYDVLKATHQNEKMPVWGVASGMKSSEANKWNKISENDLAVFFEDGSAKGFALVKNKFQSENVANKLWPSLQNQEARQYLVTFEKFVDFNEEQAKKIDAFIRSGRTPTDTFEVTQNKYSLNILEYLGFANSESSLTSAQQGFGLSAAEKKVVEMHAVHVAMQHLLNLGFTEITDVGNFESYDIRGVNGLEIFSFEVKGTTGSGDSIILTRNEVDFQKKAYPLNGLLIVSNIELVRGDFLNASGGDLSFASPWLIIEENLKPISFDYKV